MSLTVLLFTAGSLGLLGGLHCIAMCSGLQRLAIHGTHAARDPRDGALKRGFAPIGRIDPPRRGSRARKGLSMRAELRADLAFHAGRLAGYAALGALIGAGSSVMRWGAEAAPVFRPFWGMLNAGLLALGVALLVLGRQPRWIDALGQRLWSISGARLGQRSLHTPAATGAAWALLPCGLLYSALAVAALASDPLRGAAAMLAFGAGTTVNLLGAQALLQALLRQAGAQAGAIESVGIRAGGALLAAMAIAALVAIALGLPHPFCGS